MISGTLPGWMERWLGLSSRPGTGTAWRLASHWPWPAWATLLLTAALVALVAYVYRRESGRAGRARRILLALLRLSQIGLALAMAAQLELLLQRTGLPLVVAIIDDTRSMYTVDHYDDALRKSLEARVAQTLSSTSSPTRWNLARTLFAENEGELLQALSEDYKLRFYFLRDLRPSRASDVPGMVAELRASEAKGGSTRLGAAIRSALDDLRGATTVAVVLASDGINTEGPDLFDAAAYARRKAVPLFLVGIGSDRPARDLKLSDLEVEESVFVNDLVQFRCKLTASGFAGKTVGVVLRREIPATGNEQAKSETVARIDVNVAADGRPQQVVIPYRPTQPGRLAFTIQVEADPRDTVKSAPLTGSLRVRDERIRVLLADGSPRYEWRYLYNMLLRDATIELHTWLQEADREFSADEKSKFLADFPVGKEELGKYDAVIFGDVNPALLSPAALQNLADYVDRPERGHALVLIAGPNFMPKAYADTPLARLLPFDPVTVREPPANKLQDQGFVAQLTELGRSHAATQLEDSSEKSQARWRNLPPLYWMIDIPDLKQAAAQVLAEHPSRTGPDGKRLPLIVLQYVGGGRVLFHATDETYRWRWRTGDFYFGRYWLQMLRFLTRAKLAEGDRTVRLSADRADYRLGDPIRLQAHFADERAAPLDDHGVMVELEQTGRQTEKVQLHRSRTDRGRFEIVLQALPVGKYHAKIVAPVLPTGVPAADFTVEPPTLEAVNVPMDAAAMQQAAALTNGKYYPFQDAARLAEDLPGGRQVPLESLPPLPLWNRWPVLLLFLLLLIAEWVLRKRSGMV